jgi:hypothetical protein
MDKQPQGTKKWSLLTPKQQTQLKYQRAKWRATRSLRPARRMASKASGPWILTRRAS